MSKITRRSYKRKKIIMGAALFGAIGLVSTGFAAWVLSAPAVTDKTTNLSVGTVSDKNMKFENIISYKKGDNTKTADDTFHFEPEASDVSGRVRYDGVTGESLSLMVEGQLLHVQNLGQISAEITIAQNKSNFDSAIEKGYIVAPEAYKASDQTLPVVLWANDASTSALFESSSSGEADKTMSFTYEVKFAWGSFFNSMNPSRYFDETDAGKAVEQGSGEDARTENTVGGILNDLHALLDGIQLKLTLTADPN